MKKIILYALAFCIGLAFSMPFLWVLLSSLKTDQDIYHLPIRILPEEWTFIQYTSIFSKSPELATYFMNSAIVSIVSILMVVLFGAMAGYAFARHTFFGKKTFFTFLLIVMFVPWVIFLVPIYMLEDTFSLTNTKLGLILPYIALNLPLAIFIMRSNFLLIPREVEEAALVDGCSIFQMWYRIMLPMVKPGLSTVVILTAISVWEEFMYARTLITVQEEWTIPIGITMLQQEAQSWAFGTLSAAIILSLLPLLAVFLIFQRNFIKGISDGAVKG